MPPNQNIQIGFNVNTSGLSSAATKATSAFKTIGNSVNQLTKQLTTLSAAMSKVGKLNFSASTNALGAIGGSISRINRFFDNHNKVLAQSANQYKGLVGQVSNLNRFVNVLGSSVRQIGQGLQNFATVFSLYISAPMMMFIGGMTKGLIEFQDRMIEVRRTSGMTMEAIEKLGKALQEYSLITPTKVEDLATMAAAWGRLGVVGEEAIAKLTASSDKMMIATNLTADQVVDDMGKIASFYFHTSESVAANYDRLASAINELGQASPLTETEIIAAALRAAPTAAQLDISLPDLLGIVTTVAERAASPERAGSQLQRALTQQASNLDAFSKALGMTNDEVARLIDSNADQFFLDMMDAIATLPSATQRVQVANALFGGVGEKAINALTVNMPGLYDNIVLANEAWADGTSVQMEYLRSLDSVKNQLAILQNNFSYLGYTIAAEVLPYISKFAEITIPVLRSATEAFSNLNDRTKLLIVGIGALIAVVGPLTLFIGSLMFSVGIITTGFTALFTQVIGVVGGIGRLLFAIVSLLAPVSLLKIAILGIGAAFIYITKTASDAGNLLAGYISQFVSWGYGLMSGFLQGILGGASLIYNAISSIISSIGKLFGAFTFESKTSSTFDRLTDGIGKSEDGIIGKVKDVLTNTKEEVDQGAKALVPVAQESGEAVGEAVADGVESAVPAVKDSTKKLVDAVASGVEEIIHIGATFSEGFANAIKGFAATGVDLFSDIFGNIRNIIESVGSNLGLDRFDINDRILKAADAVAALVSAVESGGSASGGLSAIYDLMGGLGDETEDLINAQLRYNEANKELARIKKDMASVDDDLRKEIESISARTDLTQNEKTALIRNARLRSSVRKDDLKEEQEAAQERVDTAEEEMSRLETILRTLSSLIFSAEKEKIKDDSDEINESLAGAFDPGSSIENMGNAQDRLGKLWDETIDDADNFLTKIDKASKVWEGFLAGLRGDSKFFAQFQGEDFMRGFTPGAEIRKAWQDIQKALDNARGAFIRLYNWAIKLRDAMGIGLFGGYNGISLGDLERFNLLERILINLAFLFGAAAKEAEAFVGLLEGPIKNISVMIDTAWGDTDQSKTFLQVLDFEGIGRTMAEGFNAIIERYFALDGETFKTFTENISASIGGVVGLILAFLGEANLQALGEAGGMIVAALINSFSVDNLSKEAISGATTSILEGIIGLIAGSSNNLKLDAGDNLLTNIFNGIIDGLAKVKVTNLTESLGRLLRGLVNALATTDWVSLGSSIASLINALLTELARPELWQDVGATMSGLIEGVITILEELDWGLTEDVFAGLLDAIGEALSTLFSNGDSYRFIVDQINVSLANMIAELLDEVLPWGYNARAYYDPDAPGRQRKYDKETGEVYPTAEEAQALAAADQKAWWDWLWGGIDRIMTSGEWQEGAPTSGTGMFSYYDIKRNPEDLSKQAQEDATAYQTEFVNSVSAGLYSTDSVGVVTSGVDTMMANTTRASKEDITTYGTRIGDFTMSGVAGRFKSEDSQTDLDTLLPALNRWVITSQPDIEKSGNSFGGHFIKGVRDELEDISTYMNPVLVKMSAWFRSPVNAVEIQNLGHAFATAVLRGMAPVMGNAANKLAEVMQAALTGVPKTAEQIAEMFPHIQTELSATSSSLSAKPTLGLPSLTDSAGGDVYYISVSVGSVSSKKDADQIATSIEETLRKKANLRR